MKKRDRLAEDAAKAKAANMSYGKWKALQMPDKPAPPPPKEKHEWTCQVCGAVIIRYHKRKMKYCSPECKYQADIERKRINSARWREEHPGYITEYMKEWRKKNAVSEV